VEWSALGALAVAVLCFYVGCRLSYVQGHLHGYDQGRQDSDRDYRTRRLPPDG